MSVEGFEWVWERTLEGINGDRGAAPSPSSELKPLLQALYDEACRRPEDESRLEQSIRKVLEFLASSNGRSHDNCLVTSTFLMPGDEYWEADWADLSEKHVEILAIMGHELGQAVEDPESCREFEGLPEQLLEQLSARKGVMIR